MRAGATVQRGALVAAQAAAILLLAVAWGCGGAADLGPPEIQYGEDICARCGMIVSDERFAAATVQPTDSGTVKLIYDDIGCVLEEELSGAAIDVRWVRAFTDDDWLRADRARFVHSRDLHSPMAFNLAACADEAAARDLALRYPGPVLDLAGVRERHRAGALVTPQATVIQDGSEP